MPSYKLFTTKSGNDPAQEGVAVSGAGSKFSAKFRHNGQGLCSFTLRWTGNLVGTFKLYYSDKDQPDPTSTTDWKQDPSWTPTNPAGSAGSESYQISGISKRWVMVEFVWTSGSGTLFGEQGA